MESIYFQNIRRLRENQKTIEAKLEVRIIIKGKHVTLEGEPVNEYEAFQVLDAMNFGFDLKDALLLASENFIFRKLPIKQFTRRKDLEEVRGRVIGTEGKTKRTVENVSGCAIVVHDNMVGLIGPAENIEEATTAVGNLIRGSKQSNVYRFLERMNTAKRAKSDLGLKSEEKENEETEDTEEEKEEN
jgi:ribosomal RNA assembly protein